MKKKGNKLPVIIGQGLMKGYMIMPSKALDGMDLWIVWLKHDVPTGEPFLFEDVDKVDTILHFCDRKSVDNMIKALKELGTMWTRKGNNDDQVE